MDKEDPVTKEDVADLAPQVGKQMEEVPKVDISKEVPEKSKEPEVQAPEEPPKPISTLIPD